MAHSTQTSIDRVRTKRVESGARRRRATASGNGNGPLTAKHAGPGHHQWPCGRPSAPITTRIGSPLARSLARFHLIVGEGAVRVRKCLPFQAPPFVRSPSVRSNERQASSLTSALLPAQLPTRLLIAESNVHRRNRHASLSLSLRSTMRRRYSSTVLEEKGREARSFILGVGSQRARTQFDRDVRRTAWQRLDGGGRW